MPFRVSFKTSLPPSFLERLLSNQVPTFLCRMILAIAAPTRAVILGLRTTFAKLHRSAHFPHLIMACLLNSHHYSCYVSSPYMYDRFHNSSNSICNNIYSKLACHPSASECLLGLQEAYHSNSELHNRNNINRGWF